VNPTATAIAAVLAAAGDSPLFSAVSRVTEELEAETEAFLNYALFVKIVPASPKQAAERILFELVSRHLLLTIVVVAASDYQILEVIVSTLSADVAERKSKHFSYCITALLLMHIKPEVESVVE